MNRIVFSFWFRRFRVAVGFLLNPALPTRRVAVPEIDTAVKIFKIVG